MRRQRPRLKAALGITALMAVVLAVWATLIEPGLLFERQTTRTWSGPRLRVAFFSDLHAGAPHVNASYVGSLIDRINAESPDLVLIGGDLVINGIVGGSPVSIAELAPALARLKAPLGVFAVLGNHDWWNDGDEITATLIAHGIRVLENETVRLTASGGASFWLCGIGDAFTGHADPERAMANLGEEPRIVFMHDPGALLDVRRRFEIAFAGHLHGGQVYVPGYGALVVPGRAPRAWAAKEWLSFPLGSLLVSNGIGTSILPIRFNAPPEFVVADLGMPAQ